MRKLQSPALISAIFSTMLLFPSSSFAFDCNRAENAAEKTICSQPKLKKMDRQLNIYYKMARSKLSPAKKSKLRDSQLKWLSARNDCGSNAKCIRQNYQNWFSQFNKYKDKIMGK